MYIVVEMKMVYLHISLFPFVHREKLHLHRSIERLQQDLAEFQTIYHDLRREIYELRTTGETRNHKQILNSQQALHKEQTQGYQDIIRPFPERKGDARPTNVSRLAKSDKHLPTKPISGESPSEINRSAGAGMSVIQQPPSHLLSGHSPASHVAAATPKKDSSAVVSSSSKNPRSPIYANANIAKSPKIMGLNNPLESAPPHVSELIQQPATTAMVEDINLQIVEDITAQDSPSDFGGAKLNIIGNKRLAQTCQDYENLNDLLNELTSCGAQAEIPLVRRTTSAAAELSVCSTISMTHNLKEHSIEILPPNTTNGGDIAKMDKIPTEVEEIQEETPLSSFDHHHRSKLESETPSRNQVDLVQVNTSSEIGATSRNHSDAREEDNTTSDLKDGLQNDKPIVKVEATETASSPSADAEDFPSNNECHVASSHSDGTVKVEGITKSLTKEMLIPPASRDEPTNNEDLVLSDGGDVKGPSETDIEGPAAATTPRQETNQSSPLLKEVCSPQLNNCDVSLGTPESLVSPSNSAGDVKERTSDPNSNEEEQLKRTSNEHRNVEDDSGNSDLENVLDQNDKDFATSV